MRGRRCMPKVAVTFACGLYDRMSALYTGEVKPEGIDLNFLIIDEPRQIFDRMGKNLEFDACEMSSTEVFSRLAAGRNEMVALPVFPSRVFRRGFHSRLAAGRVWGRFVGRALGAGRHQQPGLAWQSVVAIAHQASLDRTERVRPFAE